MSTLRRSWMMLLTAACIVTGGAAPAADDPPESVWQVRLRAIDESTQVLIPRARVTVQLGQGDEHIRELMTDASGEFVGEFPTRTPRYCYIRARAEGYVPMRAFWSTRANREADPLPEEFTFEMARGTTVSGRVVDEEGQPIAGATVRFSAGDFQTYPGRRAEQSFYGEQFKTDDDGRWRCDFAPPGMHSGSINVDHPDFAYDSTNWSVDDRIDELRAGTYTSVLKKGFTVRGRVVDPDDKPVEGAVLAIGELNAYDYEGPFPRTDAAGRYEFRRIAARDGIPNDDPVRMTITVLKPGFGPQMQLIPGFGPGAMPPPDPEHRVVDFQLKPGDTVRMRVVDRAGRPIEGAAVYPGYWRETSALQVLAKFGIRGTTDADGRWEWTWAPAGEPVHYDVSARGYADAPEFELVPDPTKTVTVTLSKPQIVTGTVVDAETKAPIGEFVIQKGFEGFRQEPDGVHWDAIETRGKEGLYRKEITLPAKSYKYRVKADGYQPAISVSIPFDEGEVQVDFALRRVREE